MVEKILNLSLEFNSESSQTIICFYILPKRDFHCMVCMFTILNTVSYLYTCLFIYKEGIYSLKK